MLFNSLQFPIFFSLVWVIYFLISHPYRSWFLLLASIYFYISFIPKYFLVILVLILSDYFLAILIEKTNDKVLRRCYFGASLAINLGVLFVFKYFDFFNDNLASLAKMLNFSYGVDSLKLLLPVGLSFVVFQDISYVTEVYRGRQKAERYLWVYALYVMFFPKLLAGPIERPQHLLPQFKKEIQFSYIRTVEGLRLMLWGFFKKLVVADNAAILVNHIYDKVPDVNGPTLIIAMLVFSCQLYCDFSGYSDIAVGSSRALGFELVNNFNRPYVSRTISEFWTKWHISLSSWLKDYVYYPVVFALGGLGKFWIYVSISITFLLIGLWHGASWTYVTMGAIYSFYIVFGAVTKRLRDKISKLLYLERIPRIHNAIRTIITFNLVSIAWIFFRSENLAKAWYIVTHLLSGLSSVLSPSLLRAHVFSGANLGVSKALFINLVLAILFVEYIESMKFFSLDGDRNTSLFHNDVKVRWLLYYFVIFWILIFGYFGAQSFIYFKF